jgi:hypothetical protein
VHELLFLQVAPVQPAVHGDVARDVWRFLIRVTRKCQSLGPCA